MSILPIQDICLTVEARLVPVFFQLLQSGFRINVSVGCTVKSLLCEQLGVTPEYLEKRIQTIFLDGKPVDDVEIASRALPRGRILRPFDDLQSPDIKGHDLVALVVYLFE